MQNRIPTRAEIEMSFWKNEQIERTFGNTDAVCNKLRPLLFIFFILTVSACWLHPRTKDLITQDLKYSAYYWHFNQSSNHFEFYLDHSINVDSTGKFVLMRHESWMRGTKYFTGSINDTLCNLIESAFANKSYKTNYSYSTDNGIYDGLTYSFDYNINGINRKIFFIPQNTPEEIRRLAAFLDTFIIRTKLTKIDPLNLKNYTDTLESLDSAPPSPNRPSPPKIEVENFKQKNTE